MAKLMEREEAEGKERVRDQRKALLKQKRNTNAELVQARHAANEQLSKVNRGEAEISKVQTEIDRLDKWRQGQLDRFRKLFQNLVDEQVEMEAEFSDKYSEAADIRSTLVREQGYVEEDMQMKKGEVNRVEAEAEKVDESLKRLDDENGLTWHGSLRALTCDSSIASPRLSADGTPSAAIRKTKSESMLPSTESPLLLKAGEPNGMGDKHRQLTAMRPYTPQPSTLSNAFQMPASTNSKVVSGTVAMRFVPDAKLAMYLPGSARVPVGSPGASISTTAGNVSPHPSFRNFTNTPPGPFTTLMRPVGGYPTVTGPVAQGSIKGQPQCHTRMDGRVLHMPVMHANATGPTFMPPPSSSFVRNPAQSNNFAFTDIKQDTWV